MSKPAYDTGQSSSIPISTHPIVDLGDRYDSSFSRVTLSFNSFSAGFVLHVLLSEINRPIHLFATTTLLINKHLNKFGENAHPGMPDKTYNDFPLGLLFK